MIIAHTTLRPSLHGVTWERGTLASKEAEQNCIQAKGEGKELLHDFQRSPVSSQGTYVVPFSKTNNSVLTMARLLYHLKTSLILFAKTFFS